jgi:predicted TIM-barrel fold metal-dependent hydrolase
VTDAYCHLDIDHPSPIDDMEQQMSSANVSRAFLIETWDGRNRRLLWETNKFSVALCYRAECRAELLKLMKNGELTGIRMSTADIGRDPDFCREMAKAAKTLVAHAESGIGMLCRALMRLGEMKIYIPHLAWPIKDGTLDGDWEEALQEFAPLTALRIGVSAIAHFSSQPFPHDDVRKLALEAIARFPASRIAIGSDYPLFERSRYADYIYLAYDWVTSVHPDWNSLD